MSQQPPNQDWQQPPQQPYGQPPMYPPPPPKKSRKRLWLIIGGIVLLLIIISAISNAAKGTPQPTTAGATTVANATPTATNTPIPTSTPTHALKWTTTHTFSGNGSKKTAVFSVPDDWMIVWKCNPSSFDGLNYNVIITVYNSDGTLADSGVNSTCSKSNTHDSTEVHSSGNVYFDVVSEGDWTIQVQELK